MADRKTSYISVCCSAPAKKPPCAIEKGQHVHNYLGAKPTGEASLGSWRCIACRKPCKVTRVTRQENPEAVVA